MQTRPGAQGGARRPEAVTDHPGGGRPPPPFPQRERWSPMLLRHATPRRNLPSIGRLGLLCSKSQGRLPVVWLHSPSKSSWATLHTVRRHGGRVEGVVIIELDVPRG